MAILPEPTEPPVKNTDLLPAPIRAIVTQPAWCPNSQTGEGYARCDGRYNYYLYPHHTRNDATEHVWHLSIYEAFNGIHLLDVEFYREARELSAESEKPCELTLNTLGIRPGHFLGEESTEHKSENVARLFAELSRWFPDNHPTVDFLSVLSPSQRLSIANWLVSEYASRASFVETKVRRPVLLEAYGD